MTHCPQTIYYGWASMMIIIKLRPQSAIFVMEIIKVLLQFISLCNFVCWNGIWFLSQKQKKIILFFESQQLNVFYFLSQFYQKL